MIKLRPYQEKLVNSVRDEIRKGNRKIIMALPTGAGKTYILADIAKRSVEKGHKVLALMHRRLLVQQMKDRFDDYGIESGIIMSGIETDFSCKVQIGTIQTYHRRLKFSDIENNIFFVDASIILIDEAHRSLARTFKEALFNYLGKIVIGVTATPCLASGMGMGSFYNALVDEIGIQELIEQKNLVPVRYYAPSKPDLRKIRTILGDYDKKELGKRMNKQKLIGDIYTQWAKIAGGKQTIVFAVNVKHSIALCAEFVKNGVNAEHLDSHSDDEAREDVLRRLESGDVQVVCNVGLYTEGFDYPGAECIVLARPTKSMGLYRQMCGRGLRPYPNKTECVARGTKILTDKGNVEIQNITLDNRIWDGVLFVHHDGAVCKGEQETITYSGLTATLTHEVMTNEGWKPFQEAAYRRLRLIKTGFGGVPLRYTENYIQKNRGEMGQIKSLCSLRKLWTRIYDYVSQFKKKATNKGLSFLQPSFAHGSAFLGLSAHSSTKRQMREQKQFTIQGLWRKRNKVQIQNSSQCNSLDKRELRNTREPKKPNRQNRKQQALRTRQFKMDFCCNKYKQFKTNKRGKSEKLYKFQKKTSLNNVCRQYFVEIYNRWIKRTRNNKKMVNPFKQTKREVWDIHNAGSLQRFTANGLLVHNCVVIDHGGCIDRLGFIEDGVEWSLDGKKTAYKKKVIRKKEKTIITCPECTNVFIGNICPQCGFKIKNWGKLIETTDDDLIEVGKNRKIYTKEEKRKWYGMLEYHRREKGYQEGWKSHKYKERFGVWPKGMKSVWPTEPNQEFKNYMKHLFIKWAKSKSNPKNQAYDRL